MGDRPALEEIEVTPEMVEAGRECVFDLDREVIRNIYIAMERTRRTKRLTS